jgi:tetratricopeptide (TPR) repeat protein
VCDWELQSGQSKFSLIIRIFLEHAFKEALPYFEKAHRLDPLFSESYRGEGYACFMAHKYDEAIIQYRKALELEPDAITESCRRVSSMSINR